MKQSYLASANGYKGFINLFSEIYDPNKFDRIFIIKGGPGTGKNTFMKKICSCIENKKANIEYYYCSSDVTSLDGVIFHLNGKRIAMLDGTAPHERDAVYPGAVDEIVNLGDGLDISWLSSYRDKIIELSNKKTQAYKSAYMYLSIAGKCDEEIYNIIEKHFNINSAEKYIEKIKDSVIQCRKNECRRLFVSYFNKNGYQKKNIDSEHITNYIKIGGNTRKAEIFIRLANSYISSKYKLILLSPLNPDHMESVILDNSLSLRADSENYDINSEELFNDNKLINEETKYLNKMHDSLLEKATRYFLIASNIHFEIENIYQSCMNFDINDAIFDKTYKKILKICECTE